MQLLQPYTKITLKHALIHILTMLNYIGYQFMIWSELAEVSLEALHLLLKWVSENYIKVC